MGAVGAEEVISRWEALAQGFSQSLPVKSGFPARRREWEWEEWEALPADWSEPTLTPASTCSACPRTNCVLCSVNAR